MKTALKTIGMIGATIGFCIWTYFAYQVGYEECELDTENAKLKEELENKKI